VAVTAIRRLALCLDGTWNSRDDSTNVLHHFGLATECKDHPLGTDTVTQLKFYLEGVGTGPLDKITGGGFGFGLEPNVRAAYNWLVQNFEDATPLKQADEIFIFGFSRGAFTARSLVGFIATCGLLRRGAPLTVTQLWQNYCLIGRQREHHTGALTALFGESHPEFRRLPELVWDPWLIDKSEADAVRGTNRVAGLRVSDLNDTEELLVRWSRRVQITYLGVYDTVGAVGWDALAIPGVQGRLALHHNMRPTSLIQRCRHALAIDEHRSNFRHTPFVAYIDRNPSEELGRLASTDRRREQSGTHDAATSLASAWASRIEQRWFVGSHSNVGGGYKSNPLAQAPLKWLLDGACRAGLLCDQAAEVVPSPVGRLGPRDSFAEFCTPFWTSILRAKRTYRTIDPVPEVRANRRRNEVQPGFTLCNINEHVDDSVVRYWENRSNPPPNLVEYARRHAKRQPESPLAPLADKAIHHLWMGDGFLPYLGLLLWATVAAAGFLVVDTVFNLWPATPPAWLLAAAAGAFALVDWAESAQNFTVAARGESPPRRAFLDSIYWTRALGVVLFLFGAGGVLYFLATIGAGSTSLSDSLNDARPAVTYWVLISLGAGLGVGLGVVLNHLYARSQSPPARIVLQAAVIGPVISTAVILLATIIVSEVWRLVGPALDLSLSTTAAATTAQRFAGLLLLLQLGLIYFANAFSWAGRPMAKAYLGSIVRLQLRVSPPRVKECLDRWCSMMVGPQAHKTGCRMRAVVRETLYRDIIGFIPVYTLVFAFGLWFGAWQLGWLWLQSVWLIVPLTAAAVDYIEDICHLRYLELHERNEAPSLLLTWLGAAMTLIKLIAFIGESALTFLIVIVATLRIHSAPAPYGWRGVLAVAISTATVSIVAGLGVWSVLYRLSTKAKREHDTAAATEPQFVKSREGSDPSQFFTR
jgi:uncharacterized protein (DUF2235 family)